MLKKKLTINKLRNLSNGKNVSDKMPIYIIYVYVSYSIYIGYIKQQ